MKRILWVFGLLAALPASAAQQPGQLGLGVLIGDPTGASAKYWITPRQAVNFGIGASQSLVLHADYVWHEWKAVPQPRRGDLGAYVSLGARLETRTENDFGFRTMLGLDFWPAVKRPVEFFLEIGPVFQVLANAHIRVDGGFGMRYYFGRAK